MIAILNNPDRKDLNKSSFACFLTHSKSWLRKAPLLPTLIMGTVAVTCQPALSYEECPSTIYNRAYSYAQTIVTDSNNMMFLMPLNLRTNVEQCTYFPEEDAFVMNLEVGWNHPWVDNKPYYANLKITSSSTNGSSWQLLDFNPNLFQHLVTVGILESMSQ